MTESANTKPPNIALASDILKQRFGDRFQVGASVREQHAHTLTYIENQPPDAVVFAQSADDIAWIVQVCAQHK